MIMRALDGEHDWTFGNGTQDYLTANRAIAQNIDTRLLSFFQDCFFDMQFGLDWFRLLGSKGTEQEIILSVRAMILQSYGVVKVNKIDTSFVARNLTLSYNIDTIFTEQFAQNLEVLNA